MEDEVVGVAVRVDGESDRHDVPGSEGRPAVEGERKRLVMFLTDVFARFYPIEHEEHWPPALIAWCRMIRDCSPEKQMALQKS